MEELAGGMVADATRHHGFVRELLQGYDEYVMAYTESRRQLAVPSAGLTAAANDIQYNQLHGLRPVHDHAARPSP
jgi:hypothetical protein